MRHRRPSSRESCWAAGPSSPQNQWGSTQTAPGLEAGWRKLPHPPPQMTQNMQKKPQPDPEPCQKKILQVPAEEHKCRPNNFDGGEARDDGSKKPFPRGKRAEGCRRRNGKSHHCPPLQSQRNSPTGQPRADPQSPLALQGEGGDPRQKGPGRTTASAPARVASVTTQRRRAGRVVRLTAGSGRPRPQDEPESVAAPMGGACGPRPWTEGRPTHNTGNDGMTTTVRGTGHGQKAGQEGFSPPNSSQLSGAI